MCVFGTIYLINIHNFDKHIIFNCVFLFFLDSTDGRIDQNI